MTLPSKSPTPSGLGDTADPSAPFRLSGPDPPPGWPFHDASHDPAEAHTGAHMGTHGDRLAELLEQLPGALRDVAEILETLGGKCDIQLADIAEIEPSSETVPKPAPPQLLTVADLAHRLRVDQKTVRRWREERRLPAALEVGGVIRWDPAVIDAWIHAGGPR